METLSLVINENPNNKGVLENSQTVICYYQISLLKGFIFDSLIGRFLAGSKIYIFGHLLKIYKLIIIRLIKRYMITFVYLITVWWKHSSLKLHSRAPANPMIGLLVCHQ